MTRDRLFPGYGELNPVAPQAISRGLDLFNTSFTNILRQNVLEPFRKNTLTSTGAFKGIVLRVANNPTGLDPSGWIPRIFGKEKSAPLKWIKVRIPEIHTALPEPAKYGGDNAEASNKIIDLYPTFIPISQAVSDLPVAPGDIVYVDFANRQNLQDPIYLGPTFDQSFGGAVGEDSSKKQFDNKVKNELKASPPKGEALGEDKKTGNQMPAPAIQVEDPKERVMLVGQPQPSRAKGEPLKGALRFPPKAPETVELFRRACTLIGVPPNWASSEGLHELLRHESDGYVGRPNYTYKPRADDPSFWPEIWAELKVGQKTGDLIKSGHFAGYKASATGLGQLTLDNVDKFYPNKRAGIGVALDEAAGMLAYIKKAYKTPENAWDLYGTRHEGY